ncbi:MAG TPA: CHAT domain-containing protein, partial [Flavitalea sp.]|nr:CHAT domain-containing protein [Flavitalea sp.]
EPIQYFFDEGTDVDHLHYFSNRKTSDAILLALQATGSGIIPGFVSIEQDALALSDRNALLKLEGGQVFTDTVTGTRPIVVLLPGIMGSNLTHNDALIWIHYLRFLTGGLTQINIKSDHIKAPSLIRTSYKKLVDYLLTSYDVVTFPFDWRMPMTSSAAIFDKKIQELLGYRQPIKLIGHSMGGVLVRDFIIQYPETWKRLNSSIDFRLIFLGSPLGGSFRIPFVLFGKDEIIGKLNKIDIFHTMQDLLNIFSRLPGLLDLLPHTVTEGNDFADLQTWTAMRKALGINNWPIPQKSDLDAFKNYRDTITKNLDAIDYTNTTYIAGKDKATVSGYRIDKTSKGEELIFLSTAEGDQSVTWASGIPSKMIERDAVFYANVSHGALANDPGLFKAIDEILKTGSTNILSRKRPVVRGEEKLFRSPEHHDFDISPTGIEKTLLALDSEENFVVTETPVRVSVSNGDLRYASFPLLGGHFINDAILYAEKAIDNNLNGALTDRHVVNLYPGDIGTNLVILKNDNDFPGAIIVGLGKPGSLTAFQLTQTTEQGIVQYLLDLNSSKNKIPVSGIGISTLAIGCGYGGLSIENSVRAILQAVENANARMRKLHTANVMTIQFVEIVEQYEDRALSCYYSVNRIETQKDNTINIITDPKTIRTLLGSRKRIPSDATEEWWNRITVKEEMLPNEPGVQCLTFSASTGGSREEERKLFLTTGVISQLLEDISVNNQWSPSLARTIFELIIPNDFKEQLKKRCHINWIVNEYTAAFPWELLQDIASDAKPLCVNSGMIRQLATANYRTIVKEVSKKTALVIGDPDTGGYVMQLPGALKEAQMVSTLFEAHDIVPATLLRTGSAEIVQALFSEDYKLIHLAGHGLYNPAAPQSSGMVIGNGVFLSTREIAQMSTVPELVFVNCCFLGKTDGASELLYQSRYKLAANIGTQLIQNGVKAVIVAGWAVDDTAAYEFTEIFYEHLFSGYNFGEATRAARAAVYYKSRGINNTWGAYQAYGDPYYKFRDVAAPQKDPSYTFIIAEQAEIELNNLHNELQTGKYSHDQLVREVEAIADGVDKAGLRNAVINETEANIYADLCEYEKAITRFETFLKTENASFSVKAVEKYCNVRAKKLVADQRSLKRNKVSANGLKPVIKDLQQLLLLAPTAERYGLLGSTFKRKGFLSAAMTEKLKSYAMAAYYYQLAHNIPGNNYPVYTLTNWYILEGGLVLSKKREWGKKIKIGKKEYLLPDKETAWQQLMKMKQEQVTGRSMDFWNLISNANVSLALLLLNPVAAEKENKWEELINVYRKEWKKAGSKANKISEIEQLELLLDVLQPPRHLTSRKIVARLKDLKTELEKIVQ